MSKKNLGKFIKNYFKTLGIIPGKQKVKSKKQTSKETLDSSKFLERRKNLTGASSIAQELSRRLNRPVGLNESATRVQDELLKKEKKFLVGGQAEIDADGNGVINARDFKILREKNKKKKGGVTSAIKKIRGIGMAKGGFKKKTPIY